MDSLADHQNLELCYKCNIRAVTIYVFSIENFKRPKAQVDTLMELFKTFLQRISERGGLLHRHGVSMRVVGRLELLEPDLLSTIKSTTDLARDYGEKVLNICLSYTSRDEIASAMRQTVVECGIPAEAATQKSDFIRDSSVKRSPFLHSNPTFVKVEQVPIAPDQITSETLSDRMLIAKNPPLDILIRTSGAHRLSDFLLWQCHQATYILFVETMWPDFGLWQFFSALREWQQWKRRVGNESKEVSSDKSDNLRRLNVQVGEKAALWVTFYV